MNIFCNTKILITLRGKKERNNFYKEIYQTKIKYKFLG